MIKKGDIVYYSKLNLTGTVVIGERSGFNDVGVDFGEGFLGHKLWGNLDTGTGWWCDIKGIKLINKRKTNINKYIGR